MRISLVALDHNDLVNAIAKQINILEQLQLDHSSDEFIQANTRYQWSMRSFGIAVALVIAATAAGAWLLIGAITGPIRQAVAIAKRVATGNMGEEIQFEGHSEMAEMLRALHEMQASLGQVVSEVRINTDSARQANNLALQAARDAALGGKVVAEVVNTMVEINASSRKIGDIIGVIDGIAFQTNILALNAAVEAARAGEQGRGFAVVATEVRALASRSASAAKEIKMLIQASVERVETGTVLVDRAGKTMEALVGSIAAVTEIVAQISASGDSQNSAVEQVSDTLNKMVAVTQRNSSMVEEIASSANDLSAQANTLVSAVAVFKLQPQNSSLRLR